MIQTSLWLKNKPYFLINLWKEYEQKRHVPCTFQYDTKEGTHDSSIWITVISHFKFYKLNNLEKVIQSWYVRDNYN